MEENITENLEYPHRSFYLTKISNLENEFDREYLCIRNLLTLEVKRLLIKMLNETSSQMENSFIIATSTIKLLLRNIVKNKYPQDFQNFLYTKMIDKMFVLAEEVISEEIDLLLEKGYKCEENKSSGSFNIYML